MEIYNCKTTFAIENYIYNCQTKFTMYKLRLLISITSFTIVKLHLQLQVQENLHRTCPALAHFHSGLPKRAPRP